MAKKPSKNKKKPAGKSPARKSEVRRTTTPKAAFKPAQARATSPVRNTPAPRSSGRPIVTPELIAKRAYEIYSSGRGGSETENWLSAERELRGA